MTPAEAHRKVRTALAHGRLVRPSACSKCGASPPAARGGRQRIQAHHHLGYDKPLDIEWLCAKCHRAVTPLPARPGAPAFGEDNGQARLTRDQVIAIKTSPLGCKRLARIYGVAKSTIQRARNGRHWGQVDVGRRSHMRRTNVNTFDAGEFVRERDAALLSLDLARINAYMRKYGSPEMPDNEIGWRAIHKARTAITNFPAEEKQKSKAWLFAHGSAHWDDAP